jgi:hypothetical protein
MSGASQIIERERMLQASGSKDVKIAPKGFTLVQPRMAFP